MTEKKLPTLAVVAFLLAGMFAGVLAVNSRQQLQSEASISVSPQNVKTTNVTDNSITVSWTTLLPTSTQIRWGQGDRLTETKIASAEENTIHSVTLNGLKPANDYLIAILISGKESTYQKVTTAPVINESSEKSIISGKVISTTGEPITGALVYIDIFSAQPISTTTNTSGNWLISLENLRSIDLQKETSLDETQPVEVKVIDPDTNVTYAVSTLGNMSPLPDIIIGEQNDFTNLTTSSELNRPNAKLPSLTIERESKFIIEQ